MPKRHQSETSYRYAYNGMEQDPEVKGDGNSYTTEFRQYDPRVGRWLSLDPLMHEFPWMSPYVAFDNNPIYYTDIYGLSSDGPDDEYCEGFQDDPCDNDKEYESYNEYKKDNGDKAIAEKDWIGQDGHWLTSDRKNGYDRWDYANKFNLKTGNQGQYQAFEQVRDLYKWINRKLDYQGHEVRWADGAISLVSNLSNLQFLTKYANDGSFIKLLMELNVEIANMAVIEFGKLIYGGGGVMRGIDAYEWDKRLVIIEQKFVAAPVYHKYRGTLGLSIMENVSYSNGGSLVNIPNFGMFRESYKGKPAISLADDWGIRVDIPLLMLYPNHKPISIMGKQYIDPNTGTLNARYLNYIKYFIVR